MQLNVELMYESCVIVSVIALLRDTEENAFLVIYFWHQSFEAEGSL